MFSYIFVPYNDQGNKLEDSETGKKSLQSKDKPKVYCQICNRPFHLANQLLE